METMSPRAKPAKPIKIEGPEGLPPTTLSFQDILPRSSVYRHTGNVLMHVQLRSKRGSASYREGLFVGIQQNERDSSIVLHTSEGKVAIPDHEIGYVVVLRDPSSCLSKALPQSAIRREDLPGITKPAANPPQDTAAVREKIDALMERLARGKAVTDPVQSAEMKMHFYGQRLSLSHFHPEIQELLVYKSRVGYNCFKEEYALPWYAVYHPSSGLIAAVEQGAESDKLLKSILTHLNGNELEQDCTKHMARKIDPEYWAVRDEIELKVYARQIHPSVSRALISTLKCFKPEDDINVVDLLGGEGNVVRNLTHCDPIKNRLEREKCSLHVVDGHGPSVAQAKRNFACISPLLHAHHQDVTKMASLSDTINAQPHVVTAIGGLTRGVLTREEAAPVAEKVFRDLKPGGFFILSGFTALVLNASDFSKIGFSVVNQTIPKNVLEIVTPPYVFPDNPTQLYILKKPEN